MVLFYKIQKKSRMKFNCQKTNGLKYSKNDKSSTLPLSKLLTKGRFHVPKADSRRVCSYAGDGTIDHTRNRHSEMLIND